MRCAQAGLAVLAMLASSRAASVCYSDKEEEAHTTGEVCASIWNSYDTTGYMRLRESGRCDQCGQCAPTGPLQYAPERGQGWAQISSAFGCESNREGISPLAGGRIDMDLEATINDCLKACEENEACFAVDFRCSKTSNKQICTLFDSACEDPRLPERSGYGAASYRIVPKGEDTHSRPLSIAKGEPEKLEVRVVDGLCGDPEYKSLEYCGEHSTYVVHDGEKDTVRLEVARSDAEWKESACWKVRESEFFNGWSSFESKIKRDDPETTDKNEGYYLSLSGSKAKVSKFRSSDNWKKQASWHLRYPVTEKALCEAHTDAAGFPNCVWSEDLPKLPAGEEADPDAEPVGFYWGEAGDAANGDVKTFSVGQHSFSPFEVPTFTEPDTQVEAVNVEFEEGYEEGHDHLHIDPEYAAAKGLTVTWDKSTGSLRLGLAEGKTMSAAEWAEVIAQVHFETESTELHHRKIVWNFGDDSFYADETEHFYKEVQRKKGVTWAEARDDCASRTLLGQTGYLVTITSAVEQEIVAERMHARGWIGGCDGPGTSGKRLGTKCANDRETGCEDYEGGDEEWGREGEWRWCTGPESDAYDVADEKQGMMFWKGTGNSGIGAWPQSTTDMETEEVTVGHGYDAMFSNWAPNQPDNRRGNEDCAELKSNGEWQDRECSEKRVKSFICEWNGGGSLREAHGSVTVKVRACLSKPCNYQTEKDCQRDPRKSNPKTEDGPGGCHWYASEGEGLGACYPRCEKEHYGALCDRHCNNQDTCNNHGRCDKEGYCKCNNGWAGPNCNWECTRCTAWGDPHHTNFAGVKFDNHNVGKQQLLFSRPFPCPASKGAGATECHDFVLYANNYQCSGNDKRPIGCMDQVTLRDVNNGLAISIDVEDRNTKDTEHGQMWYTEDGKTPVMIDASTITVPYLIVDDSLTQEEKLKRKPAVLLSKKRISNKKFKWEFELPSNGQMHTRIEIEQDNSWKAPYMNIWVHHCGPLCATQPDATGNSAQVSCVQGLCNGDCGDSGKWRTGISKDCTDAFANGDFDCPGRWATPEECGQPHHPIDPKPKCLRDEAEGKPPIGDYPNAGTWCFCDPNNKKDADVMQMTSEALAWADDACCRRFKECGGTDKSKTGNYDQCMIEHCNMAWMGSAGLSQCLASVEEAILKQGQCADVLCPDGFEGEKCDRCKQDRFGKDCSKTCDAKTKCNDHGQCSGEGECECQDGWDFEEEVDGEMKYCLHECRRLPREKCAGGTVHATCQWVGGKCEKKCDEDFYGKDCAVKCTAVSTCNAHGRCDASGKCMCEEGYEGEGCTADFRECTISGRMHVSSFPETNQPPTEFDQSDELVELFRSPGEVKQPSTNGGPVLRDQYGVTAMTYQCGASRCIRRIAIYSGMALHSVEIRADGTFVKASACQGTANPKECPDVCGDLACSPECGDAQDIDKMKAQGMFDTGAFNVQPFGDMNGKVLKITNVDKKNDGTLSFTLEIPGVVSVKVLTGVDNGRSMHVSVRQTGTTGLQDYGGLCAGKSAQPAHKTWFCPDSDDPLPPDGDSCDSTAVEQRVTKCCGKYKGCHGNDDTYKACAADECALGGGTMCLPSFLKRAAEKGCACWPSRNVVWDDMGGEDETGACTKCADGYYGESCGVFCTAEDTCSGHGKCNGKGGCDCVDGWQHSVDAAGMTLACAVKEGCAEGGAAGWETLDAEFACANVEGKKAVNKEKVLPVRTPGMQPSLDDCKKLCVADAKCNQIDWWPELSLCGIYYLPATDCGAEEFVHAEEVLVKGQSFGLTRAAPTECPPPVEPKCFRADKVQTGKQGTQTSFTASGKGSTAPCDDAYSPCKDGQIVGIPKGMTCADATQAQALFFLDAWYNKNAPTERTASEKSKTLPADYELCYISGSETCSPAWQPVLRECTEDNFSPPACTACKHGYGPADSCKVQCTRDGTCSGNGNCDFGKPKSPCVCDEFRDYYYVDFQGEPCVKRMSRVPSPPPPCGQEDCSGRAKDMTGSRPDCSCTCRNKWQGPHCNVCPPGWDKKADCMRCEDGRGGANCELTCDLEAMCGANGASIQSSADGCTCRCEGNWRGPDCKECPPIFDPATCTECADKAQPHPVCAPSCSKENHCIAANTKSVSKDNNGECVCKCDNQWTGDKCDVCPAQYTGKACDQCQAGMAGSPPQCKACSMEQHCFGNAKQVTVSANGQCDCECRNAWETDPKTGIPCSFCPANFDKDETDCSECKYGYVKSKDGKSCQPFNPPKPCTNQMDCSGNAKQEPTGHVGQCECKCRNGWSGKDCSDCDRTKYGGADCDQCPKGFVGKAGSCTECSTEAVCGKNGRAATVVDGECRCTCLDQWEGPDCNICPDLYNKETGCKQCKVGVPPLCGEDHCSPEKHCHGHAVAAVPTTYWAGDFPTSECKCECRGAWGGKYCQDCPTTVSGNDCNVCAKGYYGKTPTECESCGSFCKNNPISHDSENGECKCVCSGAWKGEACDVCPENMDAACEVCLDGYTWDAAEKKCGRTPGVEPGGLIAEVGDLPCAERDCVVHKGDDVKAKISGTDGTAPGPSCQSAKCPAGTMRIVPKDASCSDASKIVQEVPLYTTAKNPEDRVSDTFKADFTTEGDSFRVCYQAEGGNSFTPVPRACPVNFERGGDGECSKCLPGWYGSDCRIFCSKDYTCHGHGRCTPSVGTCECDDGWKHTAEEAGFEKHSSQQCFKSTTGAEEGAPFFVPITADAKPSDDGDKVHITLTGTGPKPDGCNDLKDGCADGSIVLVKDSPSASCSAPRDSEVLASFPVTTTESGDRVTDGQVPVDFDTKNTKYIVCYQPKSDLAPVPAQVPNVRGAAPEDNGGSDKNPALLIALAIIAALSVAGLAGVCAARMKKAQAAKKRAAASGGDGGGISIGYPSDFSKNTTDFSVGNLRSEYAMERELV